ncbi:nucleoside/nucleotide kinase family protein [Gemmobacter fulvus]|uniref:nucleoside/nucleotide kinase family protein n=1 Tax=Gemmobacter fulvus TaxID=2840474 RepID=UPI002796B0A6|nr:nucleoside/nucleotide kinase family protein [Gemmobacter fulvus]MDQ1848552.1 nucleoside/nucleotide kinase family protein [Gemmobacter fulvus]
MTPAAIAALIRQRAAEAITGQGRFITALAGPPGAGKSTLAEGLRAELGAGARVVPMDGFHLDNPVLAARGLLARKGSPESFDAQGFVHLVQRLTVEPEVAIPVFDRKLDLARAGGDLVRAEDRLLIIEGNYLLLEAEPWSAARPFYGLTLMLDVPEAELERRLIQRWIDHDHTPGAARARALSNDIPNARRVQRESAAADVMIRQ